MNGDGLMSVNTYEKNMNELFWKRITKLFGYSNTMKSNNEELTDFFIPFEEDILLVEDKSRDKEFQIAEGLNVYTKKKEGKEEDYSNLIKDWINVCTSKIGKATKQLNGAEAYLKNKGKVYKNRKKIKDNEILYNEKARFHKIILLHNIDKASCQYFDTQYGGPIYSDLVENMNGRFQVKPGVPEENLIFAYNSVENLHILSEQQFKFLISYLPTLKDLLDYFNWKEELLKNNKYGIFTIDEYSLVCYYIEYGNRLLEELGEIGEKESNLLNVVLELYNDEDIVKLENTHPSFIKYRSSANCINNLLHYLEDNKDMADSENELKDRLMKFYLKLNIEQQLSLTEEIPKLLNMSYKETFVKVLSFYLDGCLYLFSNFDKRIEGEDTGNKYIEAVLFKYVITYIDKFQDKIDIKDIIICAMHQRDDGTIRDIYASINIEENMKNIDYFREVVSSVDAFLPKKVEENLYNLYNLFNPLKKISVKGRDRNKPCPCGSGLKYKKCCGKYI